MRYHPHDNVSIFHFNFFIQQNTYVINISMYVNIKDNKDSYIAQPNNVSSRFTKSVPLQSYLSYLSITI